MLKQKIIASLLAGLFILCIISIDSYTQIRRLINAHEKEKHSLSSLAGFERMVFHLTEIQTSMRGFIITGEDLYLEGYAAKVATIREEAGKVLDFTRGRNDPKLSGIVLADFVHQELEFVEKAIYIRRTAGRRAAERFIATGSGERLMDNIEDIFHQVQEDESKELLTQEQAILRSRKITFAVIILGSIIAMGIVLLSIISVIRELNKRMRMTENLAESERRYRELSKQFDVVLNAIPDVLTLQTPDLNIVWGNRTAAGIFGKEIEDFKGRTCYDLWHDQTTPCDQCPVLKTFQTGMSATLELKLTDGSVWELRSIPVMNDDGSVAGVIELGRDMTSHRKAQKMEAVGQLAGGIAHDFNNILTAIIGYGNLLQMGLGTNEILKSHTRQILASAERAAQLTKGLLAFSRKQIINPKPVDLNKIVSNLEKILMRVIGEDVELKIMLQKGKMVVKADASEIEHVLLNLCTNARDAMPDGGLLLIETEEALLDEEFTTRHGYGYPGRYALLSVSDSGAGMDENVKKNIFEPFFTTKREDKGTGLGLAMAYGIIKQHGGYINVYSELGKGTTFKIYLPMTVEEEKIVHERPEAAPITGKETILVAEDDKIVRELIGRSLEAFGYTPILAEDGEDAIKIFSANKEKIDFILLDLIMPKKNGKEAYDAIRRLAPDIKALFMSGYSPNLVHKRGILEEGLNLILKPVSLNDLLKKVRELLDT
jgi:signal transduction histidine kinase/CHASE3 domain sensor protein/CheY-like chemotaxis protein